MRNQSEIYADDILNGNAGYKILGKILEKADKMNDLTTLRWAYELIEGKPRQAPAPDIADKEEKP